MKRTESERCLRGGPAGREGGRRSGSWPKTITLLLAAMILLGGLLTLTPGCSPGPDDEDGLSGTLVIRGSDTMVNLAAAWAEGFMSANPRAQVSVQGGGSSTGFAALIDGSTDLANASRPIKDSEVKALQDRGKTVVEHVVAHDAVSMVVNPQNPISNLTMEQLGKVFTGAITNWKDVGGPDLAITIYSRESSSGTYAFVQEHVMDKADYVASARLMPSTESIVQAVAQDVTSLGYVGLGYVTPAIKVLGVAVGEDVPAVIPSIESASDGTYPVARALFVYSAGAPSDLAQAYLDFCVSKAGSDIAVELGFVPVGDR